MNQFGLCYPSFPGDRLPLLNILTERLIRFDRSGGARASGSLPEVYAALMADEVAAFPALRPHQRHAWHAFLVQLGAMAMHKAGVSEPPGDAAEWRRIIRALTPNYPDDEPWSLVVDDITKPAFMQPPASSREREADYKNKIATPDELDMLVTSRNHDVKSAMANDPQADEWIFALITKQTMEGYSGAGNHGISRMNGGFGSRPSFSITPSTSPGMHVRCDVTGLLEHRPALLDEYWMTEDGAGLLWTCPWDGTPAEALRFVDLDPFYIEICRRLRLRPSADGTLFAIRASSQAARIEAKALNGRTGDPWTPIDTKKGKALTLAKGGFTYKRTVDYLLGEWELPPLLRSTRGDGSSSGQMQLVARAIVRGQGKTEGYHERTIPIRIEAGSAMLRRDRTRELGDIARSRIDQVAVVQRILSHAIQSFLARGKPDKSTPEQRNLARGWLNRLDDVVDATFFDDLQTEFEAEVSERPTYRSRWLLNDDETGVINHARSILQDAMNSLPCPAIHRYRARVAAEGLFEGRIRGPKGLPCLFDDQGKEHD